MPHRRVCWRTSAVRQPPTTHISIGGVHLLRPFACKCCCRWLPGHLFTPPPPLLRCTGNGSDSRDPIRRHCRMERSRRAPNERPVLVNRVIGLNKNYAGKKRERRRTSEKRNKKDAVHHHRASVFVVDIVGQPRPS